MHIVYILWLLSSLFYRSHQLIISWSRYPNPEASDECFAVLARSQTWNQRSPGRQEKPQVERFSSHVDRSSGDSWNGNTEKFPDLKYHIFDLRNTKHNSLLSSRFLEWQVVPEKNDTFHWPCTCSYSNDERNYRTSLQAATSRPPKCLSVSLWEWS